MSGMVLQQNTINCITGICSSDERIQITFRGKTYSTRADKNGSWSVKINPGKAGGPDEMEIKCSTAEELKLTDVYTGEVWLCSGQSNMELPMKRLEWTYPEEMKAPVNENIRVCTVPISYSFDGEKDYTPGAKWVPVGPDTTPSISGTSYFFAKKLYSDLHIPVGIINASQGGSPIASWIDSTTARKWPAYAERLDECLDAQAVEAKKKEFETKNNDWFTKLSCEDKGFQENWNTAEASKKDGWKEIEVPFTKTFAQAGTLWIKKQFTLSAKEIDACKKNKTHLWLGTIVFSDMAFVNGKQVGSTPYEYPPRRYEIPAGILQEGVNEVTVRLVHAGPELKLWEEKPYCLFTENVIVKPTAPANLIGTKNGEVIGENAVYVDLKGKWLYKEGCSVENAPGNFFPEWQPTALYNSMLAPCFKMSVRGFVWYQGESDTLNNDYEKQLTQMIALWRKKFTFAAEKKAPFVIIQLPCFGPKTDLQKESDWANMREAEYFAAFKNKNCGLAVTIDAGEWNDIHPENKKTVGTRSALVAERLAYGRKIEGSPYAKSIKRTADGAIVEFNREIHIESNDMPVITAILTKKGKPDILAPLMIKAVAHTKLILMINEEQMRLDYKIKEIRYNWTGCPESRSIYDKKNEFPVIPFRLSF